MKKKLTLVFAVIFLVINIFSQINIRDLSPASPSYPHVIRMIETGIMNLDTQGRFNGSEYMPRFDIATFASRMLDHIDKLYESRIVLLENDLEEIKELNLNQRINLVQNNFDNKLSSIDQRLKDHENNLIVLEQNFSFNIEKLNENISYNFEKTENEIKEIIENMNLIEKDLITLSDFVDPNSPLNENNPIFVNLIKDLDKLVEKIAMEELKKISDEALENIKLFSLRMENFEEDVYDINEKFDKTVEYLNTIILTHEEKSREELKNYVDSKMNIEQDALKVSLRNIANTEVSYLKNIIDPLFIGIEDRLNNLEVERSYNVQEKLNSFESKLFSLEAKLVFLENATSSSDPLEVNTNEILFMKADIEELKASIFNLDSETRKLIDKNLLNEQHIQSFDKREEFYQNKIFMLEERINTFSSELIFQNKKIDNLIFENSQNKVENKNLLSDQELNAVYQRIESIERFMGTYADEISNLNLYSKSFDDYNERLKKSEEKIVSSENEIRNLKEKFNTVNSNLNYLTNMVNVTDEQIQKIGNITDLSERVGNLEIFNDVTEKNLGQSFNRIEVIEKKVNEIEKSIGSFNVSLRQMEELQKSYEEIYNIYINLKAEIDYSEDINTLKADLKSEINSIIINQLRIRDEKLMEHDEIVLNVYKEMESLKIYNKEKEEEIKTYREQLDETNMILKEVEEQLRELEEPEKINFWTSMGMGLFGVAVGAFITYFMLTSSL